MKTNTIARVQILVEVNAGAPWDEKCDLKQVYEQASRTATDIVINAFSKTLSDSNMRIVGEPKVIAVIKEMSK